MPRQITKTVYSFKELIDGKKAGVEKVRLTLQLRALNSSWDEDVIEDWKTALSQIGFEDAEIMYSGFATQGDGASFTASLNTEKLFWFLTNEIIPKECIENTERTGDQEDWLPYVVYHLRRQDIYEDFKALGEHLENITGRVVRSRDIYCHESTCSVEWDFYNDYPEELEPLMDKFEKAIEELRYDLCKVIYEKLEKQHDWTIDDEQLLELDENLRYGWDEDGNEED